MLKTVKLFNIFLKTDHFIRIFDEYKIQKNSIYYSQLLLLINLIQSLKKIH